MRFRKLLCIIFVCAITASCLSLDAGAVAGDKGPEVFAIERASGRFSIDIPGNTLAQEVSTLPLEAGETVTIKASYSPSPASVDFGLVAPDGIFYYVTAAGGSVSKTFLIEESGHYTLAIRNNSGAEISVSGRVSY